MEFKEVKDLADEQIIDQILRIEQEAFGKNGGIDLWTLSPLIRHGRVFVCLKDGQVVGVAEFMGDLSEANSAYLYGLAVKHEYRGQKVATRLLTEAFKALKGKGVKRISLTVGPQNAPAHRLYKRLGFCKKDYLIDEYGPGEDRDYLEIDLSGRE